MVNNKGSSKASNKVRVNRLAGRRMEASRCEAESAVVLITEDPQETAGVITDSFRPKFASACVKHRTCDASGEQPVWASAASTK